jgi:aryl-alcohol dehydrogenase-like predicted oxidoreductase
MRCQKVSLERDGILKIDRMPRTVKRGAKQRFSRRWIRLQGVTTVLVGSRSPEELAWNLPAFDLVLSDDVVSELSAATETVKEKIGLNPDPWMSQSRMR